MPMDRSKYPENWNEIALRVKEDADWRCQECGKQCYRPGQKHLNRQYTLTVAHLDHKPMNCDPSNLKAMCSVCHLKYDNQHRAEQREKKRAEQRYNGPQGTFAFMTEQNSAAFPIYRD